MPAVAQVAEGRILVVSSLRVALAQNCGWTVAATVVDRMAVRQAADWRWRNWSP